MQPRASSSAGRSREEVCDVFLMTVIKPEYSHLSNDNENNTKANTPYLTWGKSSIYLAL